MTAVKGWGEAHQVNEEPPSAYTGGSLPRKDGPVLRAAALVVTKEQREHHKDTPAEEQFRHLAPGWRLSGLAFPMMLRMWRADLSMLGTLILWLLL